MEGTTQQLHTSRLLPHRRSPVTQPFTPRVAGECALDSGWKVDKSWKRERSVLSTAVFARPRPVTCGRERARTESEGGLTPTKQWLMPASGFPCSLRIVTGCASACQTNAWVTVGSSTSSPYFPPGHCLGAHPASLHTTPPFLPGCLPSPPLLGVELSPQ